MKHEAMTVDWQHVAEIFYEALYGVSDMESVKIKIGEQTYIVTR